LQSIFPSPGRSLQNAYARGDAPSTALLLGDNVLLRLCDRPMSNYPRMRRGWSAARRLSWRGARKQFPMCRLCLCASPDPAGFGFANSLNRARESAIGLLLSTRRRFWIEG